MIELLVVIAIITVLVSILLPALDVAKQAARDAVCRSHISGTLYVGLALYAEDNKGWIPPAVYSSDMNYATFKKVLQGEARWFVGWTADGPEYGDYFNRRAYLPAGENTHMCPAVSDLGYGDYGLNHPMAKSDGTGAAFQGFGKSGAAYYQYNLHRTYRPAFMYLAGDCNWAVLQVLVGSHPYNSAFPAFRHMRKMNMIFHDAHTEALEIQQLPLQPAVTSLPWRNGLGRAPDETYAFLPAGFPFPR